MMNQSMVMENITHLFDDCYIPEKALLIYRCRNRENNSRNEESIYVESYDIGKNGNPINAHPLTQKEMVGLSQLFQSCKELKTTYLKSKGLIPVKVLQINTHGQGSVCWYTPACETNLLFTPALGIPSGKANVPALVWKASREQLSVFAVKGNKKPSASTPLYHAPFFNVNNNGHVCMGTVEVNIPADACLEDFVKHWEDYFWNSYFSHMMESFNPINGNMLLLWKQLVNTGEIFPATALKKTGYTIQNCLV